jgi:hypothetical protein
MYNGNIGNEGGVPHEAVTLGARVVSEHAMRSLIRCKAEHRVQEGGLSRAVGADESEYTALTDREVNAVESDSVAKRFAHAPGLDGDHLVNDLELCERMKYGAAHPD